MNTTPATPAKTVPPFAAVLHFKRNRLYQKKHESWTFRSDWICPIGTPIHKQYPYLEKFVLEEMQGTFLTASIFNNCGLCYIPFGEEAPKNNLVLYVDHNRITIDRRKNIDLSFLDWTFDKDYLEAMAVIFHNDKYLLDLKATQLHEYAKLYKENVLAENSKPCQSF